MDLDEQKKIEHQLELATRAAAYISDETTVQRLKKYAEELKQKLFRMLRRPKVRARAYELWEQAGQPQIVMWNFGSKPSGKSTKTGSGKLTGVIEAWLLELLMRGPEACLAGRLFSFGRLFLIA